MVKPNGCGWEASDHVLYLCQLASVPSVNCFEEYLVPTRPSCEDCGWWGRGRESPAQVARQSAVVVPKWIVVVGCGWGRRGRESPIQVARQSVVVVPKWIVVVVVPARTALVVGEGESCFGHENQTQTQIQAQNQNQKDAQNERMLAGQASAIHDHCQSETKLMLAGQAEVM